MPDVRYMSGAPDPFDGAGMLQTQAKFQCNGGPDTISERAEAGACQVGNHIAWVRVAGQIVGLDAEIYPPAEYWHLLCHCPIGQGGSQEPARFRSLITVWPSANTVYGKPLRHSMPGGYREPLRESDDTR